MCSLSPCQCRQNFASALILIACMPSGIASGFTCLLKAFAHALPPLALLTPKRDLRFRTALAITGAPSGGPWVKLANGRSSSIRTSARSSSKWVWSGNSKQNQSDGTRSEPLSKAMCVKLSTQWPLGANLRSGRTAPGTAPAQHYFSDRGVTVWAI
jgi:hypothetical protein